MGCTKVSTPQNKPLSKSTLLPVIQNLQYQTLNLAVYLCFGFRRLHIELPMAAILLRASEPTSMNERECTFTHIQSSCSTHKCMKMWATQARAQFHDDLTGSYNISKKLLKKFTCTFHGNEMNSLPSQDTASVGHYMKWRARWNLRIVEMTQLLHSTSIWDMAPLFYHLSTANQGLNT